MDYCKTLFGKSLLDLKFSDIEKYFQVEKTETDVLEFKSFSGNIDSGFDGVIKAIAAFLNSKGGVLIWGAPIGVAPTGKKEKFFNGLLTPINTILSKEQVISRVSDKITPLPQTIRCEVLSNGSGGCICVFETNESEYAPHQFNGSYFMRIDGQTRVAPHHYVEALFRKIRFPNLEGFIKITKISHGALHNHRDSYKINIDVFFFNWTELQNVESLSYRLVSATGVFREGYGITHELRRKQIHEVLHFGEPYRKAETLYIEKSNLKTKSSFELMLFFGARNTPSKANEYTLDLSNPSVPNLDDIIIESKENRLFKEVQDEKGGTREKTLQLVLGRKSK